MPLPVEQRVRGESLALVVLGATGDLAIKKLFPAVFSLHHQVRERSNGPRQGSLSVTGPCGTCACGDHTRGLPGPPTSDAIRPAQTLVTAGRVCDARSVKIDLDDAHTWTDLVCAYSGGLERTQGFLPPKTLIVGERPTLLKPRWQSSAAPELRLPCRMSRTHVPSPLLYAPAVHRVQPHAIRRQLAH